MSELIAGEGTIRRLWPTETDKFRDHLLRLDKDLYAAIAQWSADDLRSINSQIEFLLSEAVKRAGRRVSKASNDAPPSRESS